MAAEIRTLNDKMQMLRSYLVTMSLCTIVESVPTYGIGDMKRLKKTLFYDQHYDTLIAPVLGIDQPVKVQTSVFVDRISVDMTKQTMTSIGHFGFRWTDFRLSWQPEEFNGITTLITPLEDVWFPDISTENCAAGGGFFKSSLMKVVIYDNGDVLWNPGLSTPTSCVISVFAYPYDIQACAIEIISWTATNSTMVLVSRKQRVVLRNSNPSGEFKVLDTLVVSYQYNSTLRIRESHVGLRFVLFLERKSFYKTMTILVPVILLACLNSVVFILPSDCGERQQMSMAVLLGFAVHLGIINNNLPNTSDRFSVLKLFITTMFLLSTCATIFSAINLNIHYTNPLKPVPRFIRRIIGTWRSEPPLESIRYSRPHSLQSRPTPHLRHSYASSSDTSKSSDDMDGQKPPSATEVRLIVDTRRPSIILKRLQLEARASEVKSAKVIHVKQEKTRHPKESTGFDRKFSSTGRDRDLKENDFKFTDENANAAVTDDEIVQQGNKELVLTVIERDAVHKRSGAADTSQHHSRFLEGRDSFINAQRVQPLQYETFEEVPGISKPFRLKLREVNRKDINPVKRFKKPRCICSKRRRLYKTWMNSVSGYRVKGSLNGNKTFTGVRPEHRENAGLSGPDERVTFFQPQSTGTNADTIVRRRTKMKTFEMSTTFPKVE